MFSRAVAPFGQVAFDLVAACNDSVMPLQVGGAQQVAMTVWHQSEPKPLRKAVAIRKMAGVFATEMVALLNAGAAAPGDMAVLVKERWEARAMREELSARGVRSVYLSESDSVYCTVEASALWRILRAVSTPRSKARLKAALATRLWGLDWDEFDARCQDDAWDGVVEQFHEWQKIWQRQGLLPMLHQLIHGQAIPARLAQRCSAHDCERQLTNLLHLGDRLQAASLNLQGEAALVRYLEQQLQEPGAAGDAAQLRLESDGGLVQVITVHKSKGLQYPLVFLPFLSHYRVAKPDSGQDDAQRLEEDIRLCYVALTRAEKALWMGLSEVKKEFGDKTPSMSAVSMLLGRKAKGDLGECLQGWDACAEIVVAPAPEAGAARRVPGAAPWQPKQAMTPARVLASNWWTASFSALMRERGSRPSWSQPTTSATCACPTPSLTSPIRC